MKNKFCIKKNLAVIIILIIGVLTYLIYANKFSGMRASLSSFAKNIRRPLVIPTGTLHKLQRTSGTIIKNRYCRDIDSKVGIALANATLPKPQPDQDYKPTEEATSYLEDYALIAFSCPLDGERYIIPDDIKQMNVFALSWGQSPEIVGLLIAKQTFLDLGLDSLTVIAPATFAQAAWAGWQALSFGAVAQELAEGGPQAGGSQTVQNMIARFNPDYIRRLPISDTNISVIQVGNRVLLTDATNADPSQFGNVQNINCSDANNCPTPQVPNQPSTTPEELQEIIEGKNENSPTSQLIRQWINEGRISGKSIQVKLREGDTPIEIPYYDFRNINGKPLTAEEVGTLILRAQAEGIQVQIHVGPGNTIDPILDINPNNPNPGRPTLVLAIDNEVQQDMVFNPPIILQNNFARLERQVPSSVTDIFSGGVVNGPRNTAIYIKMSIEELENLSYYIQVPYIKIVAPYSINSEGQAVAYSDYLGNLPVLLQPGGRIDVVWHQINMRNYPSFIQYLNDNLQSELANTPYKVEFNTPTYDVYISTYGSSTSAFSNYIDYLIGVTSIFFNP